MNILNRVYIKIWSLFNKVILLNKLLNFYIIGKYYIKELHTNIEISKKYLKYKNNMLK